MIRKKTSNWSRNITLCFAMIFQIVTAHAYYIPKATQSESEIQIVQKYFEALATGDMALLDSLLSENIIWHQPGNGSLSKTYYGKQEVFSLFGQFMKISENTFKIDEVKNIMANNFLVAATLHFSAHKSNGSKLSMDGVDLMKINNGQIVEVYLFSANQSEEDAFWSSETQLKP
ncbi:nuclear transport factor 2 family protein [Legionella bononiensis]|uniref:Nuclear transport factor 2 family protein n=1 Tax=Legionella bononiensis TaxID=2793102 RepID=A0ABS1WDW0_9GAMM|nr:nuclear transport factor 2 family protein [Legionella bononiensis]MBL7479580.1 nuclear transport factor 2 family protein [Legionella bononiensis]MBL7527544.1 nuclear transport factor 2 family protein [Legionella bononiensis]